MLTEVNITYPGRDGQGVGTDREGNLYFVPGAFPGDTVQVEYEESKRYRNARLVEVIHASPERRKSPCSHSEKCGGCDWIEWDYSAQLAGKQTQLTHVLKRGGWLPERVLEPVAADSPLGYRSRIQLHRSPNGYGFFEKNTHKVVPVDQCPVALPVISERISQVQGESPTVELYLDENGQVCESPKRGSRPFVQINPAQNAVLKAKVAEALVGSEKVLELFCGAGNLTSAYSEQVNTVFAFDSDPKAVERARDELGGDGIIFVSDAVDAKLPKKLPEGFRNQYDTLLLDPPRSGLGFPLGELVHDNLKRICYVSCSPISFSKDIQSLKEQFRFDSVQIVDMFPQTRHLELVAVFSR